MHAYIFSIAPDNDGKYKFKTTTIGYPDTPGLLPNSDAIVTDYFEYDTKNDMLDAMISQLTNLKGV